MTTARASIEDLCRPNLRLPFGDYKLHTGEWGPMYTKNTSNKNYEEDIEVRTLGYAQLIAEGTPYAQDTMGQRYKYTYFHRKTGLGYSITEEAIEDNLYKDEFPKGAMALRDSLEQAKNVLACSLFNNGFNAAFPIGDGVAFFSTSHPIDTGVVANRPSTDIDLSEAALEAAIINIRQNFLNAAGLRTNYKPEFLLVPPSGEFTAVRILKGNFRPATANNDPNAMNYLSSFPGGIKVNTFLSIPNSWYIKTDCKNSTNYFSRIPVKLNVWTDNATNNLLSKATERYSFGVSNWRGWYASQGS